MFVSLIELLKISHIFFNNEDKEFFVVDLINLLLGWSNTVEIYANRAKNFHTRTLTWIPWLPVPLLHLLSYLDYICLTFSCATPAMKINFFNTVNFQLSAGGSSTLQIIHGQSLLLFLE